MCAVEGGTGEEKCCLIQSRRINLGPARNHPMCESAHFHDYIPLWLIPSTLENGARWAGAEFKLDCFDDGV